MLRQSARSRRAAWLAAALSSLLTVGSGASVGRASAPDLFGFGTRVSGMGATGTAHVNGYESVYANPAGLPDAHNKRLTVGYLFGMYELGMSQNLMRIRPPRADNSYALVIGANIPFNIGGWMQNKMWVGMGFYLPTGVVTRARVPLPGQPYFPLLESRTQVVGVMISGAVEPYPGLRIGAGVLALAALTGTVWISADAAGSIGSTVEQQLIVDYAPIFGVMWTPEWVRRMTVGLTYRGESIAGFDVVLKNTLGNALPLSIPEMTISGVAQFDPQQVAFEVAYRPLPGMLVALQVCWKDWSRFPLPTKNVTVAAAEQPLPDFHDTVIPRVGFEHELRWNRWRLALRAGYFFEPTPIKEQKGLTNLLDNHRHAFTAGLGTSYHKGLVVPLSLDLFVQWHYLMPRKHTKDQAALSAPGVDPMLLRFARSRFQTWGQLWVAGVQVGVEW